MARPGDAWRRAAGPAGRLRGAELRGHSHLVRALPLPRAQPESAVRVAPLRASGTIRARTRAPGARTPA